MSDETLLCHRCGRTLVPGRGDWFVVRIEAMADPTPPTITQADLERDVCGEIEELIEQLWQETPGTSERELMDGVYRRLVVHLCGPCYRRWIEKPV